MRLTSSRAYGRPAPVPKMPPGLVELMNGLAKEVLRHNPTNVYEFCANHMEKLIEIRDGPSSKKSMTLEEKIEKAQEKMRQKAKERREKFDEEMNLLNRVKENTDQVNEDTMLDQASSSSSSTVRALVHHEVDLQNASEVEISHIQDIATEPNEASKPDDSKDIQMKTVDSERNSKTENQSAEIIPDLKPEHEEIDKKSNLKLDDVPIFEEIDTELPNEPFKETELKDIAGFSVVDSSLQTIKESFEETLVNNATILPKIMIGDGHEMRELENISGESFTEVQADNVDQAINIVIQPAEPNAVPDSATASGGNEGFKSDFSSENIASNVVLSTENLGEVTSGDVDKQNDASDISETPIPTYTTLELTDNSTGEESIHEAHNSDNYHVDTNTAHDNDEPKSEVPTSDVVGESYDLTKDDVSNEVNQNKIEANDTDTSVTKDLNIPEKEEIPKVSAGTQENTFESQVNAFEIGSTESQSNIIDNDKPDAKPIENNANSDKENIISDTEKLQDNSEPKSENNENTNDDSMSMVESDLSKTDDDSTQNNPNMDLETAAVTIQKVFRSFMFKSRNSTFEDNINDENNSVDEDNDKKEEYYAAANLNKERRTLGITRMESVLQTVNEEKSLSLSTDDSSTLSSAATTIQAHVRGFLVRNRLNSSKTFSMNSLVNSHEALESDTEQHKNKTILNIHIVPEEGNFLSRDESLITSMDLSLDGSPPSSVNLHPMSFDISERRKMLKREDAVQSVSPPSNNSGKLSEDSVKEVLINENGVLERDLTDDKAIEMDDQHKELDNETSDVISSASTVTPTTVITISKSEDPIRSPREDTEEALRRNVRSFTKLSSDESDVITPFVPSPRSSEDVTLVHSGEFHDVVLPTKVSRNDAPVVREFKNVLVYFLLWNSS